MENNVLTNKLSKETLTLDDWIPIGGPSKIELDEPFYIDLNGKRVEDTKHNRTPFFNAFVNPPNPNFQNSNLMIDFCSFLP